jgi:hypothetical protein
MAQEFHQDASFGANEAGYLEVTLEPAVIEQRFLELVISFAIFHPCGVCNL